jgi:hypothetical protein
MSEVAPQFPSSPRYSLVSWSSDRSDASFNRVQAAIQSVDAFVDAAKLSLTNQFQLMELLQHQNVVRINYSGHMQTHTVV